MIISIKIGNGVSEYEAKLLFHELQKDAAAFCSRAKREEKETEVQRLLRAGCLAAFAYFENYTDHMLRRMKKTRQGSLHAKIKRLTDHAVGDSASSNSPDI